METQELKSQVTSADLNLEQAFQLFCIFTGDVERTAAALGVRPVDVLKAADELGWLEKLQSIIKLKKSGRPGDIERAINRALNFVQIHRLRLFLDRVIFRLSEMDRKEVEQYLFTGQDAKGLEVRKLTARALADLASACEKCQQLTYQALDDTAKAREKRIELGHDGEASGAIHAAIAKAMSQCGADQPRGMLLEAQVQTASRLAEKAAIALVPGQPEPPVHPNNNDEH